MADVEMSDAPAKKAEVAEKKKFEVKKVITSPLNRHRLVRVSLLTAPQWNAVALWAWDIVVDNCAICRNHIMDLCASSHPTSPRPLTT